MKHTALSFKLPFSLMEQIEIRGALISSLVKIKLQQKHIERLETQIKNLSFIIQEQIEEIKNIEAEKCRKPLPNSSRERRRSS